MKNLKYILFLLIIPSFSFSGVAQEKYTTINYNIGLPLSNTKDYISKTSFRGMSLEFGQFVNDNISAGLYLGWNTFYEAMPKATYPFRNGEITGKQYRYINAIPILAKGKYYLNRETAVQPFIGVGLGTYYMNYRTDMGLYSSNTNKWHFGLAGEVGINIPMNYKTDFYISAQPNYAFKAGSMDAQTWFNFHIGFCMNY